MEEMVTTLIVGPLLSTVKEKASSHLLDQYNVMEGMEEQHMAFKRKLLAILDVIADAEQVASHRDGAKAWLEEVKRVAYEANEIFDKFKYEALRREARKNGHYSKLGIDAVRFFTTHNRFAFRDKMGKKLCRVLQAVEVLVAEMNAFDFKNQQQAPTSMNWWQMDPVIFDPKKIISRSRSQDTKNIVHMLFCQASSANLTVVPIVGKGGLGKTTLAQLIYNEPEVQKHFELLIWVCVSDSFDVDSLARSIVVFHLKRSVIEAPLKKGPLDSLQIVLSGRRYLLVLDDVRNLESDKWKKLEASLAHGAKGSMILATTRDEGVAKIMGTVKAYNLLALEDNFIEEIIESRAFGLQEEQRPVMLVNMVSEIAKRCRGSPLAATVLGSILRTKTSEEEWKAISSRSNICIEESGILPLLKLSYNDMSSQMKQCFSICAMFPKNYEIDVDKLIQLWIAHGFIQVQKEISPETIGKWIFNELTSRSFFVDVKQVRVSFYEYEHLVLGDYSKYTCKVQELMHDVALSTMGKECALAPKEPSQIEWLPDTARHLFLSCGQPETILNESVAKRSLAVQTLMCDCYIEMGNRLQHLSKYCSLKALRLLVSWGGPLPLKPSHLHHLRYLDLSRSYFETLPEDISILYSLQTLNISSCYSLRRLPRQMKYMTALRHLYTHCCPRLRSMPADLRKLMSLQTLTCFVAGPAGSECSAIGELQHLNLLGGQLELNQLENATEEDAKSANIENKKDLRCLTLKWSVGCTDNERVLNGLKPHDGLLAVRIESYGGTTFPTWMAMSRNMVEIQLFQCEKLQWLFGCDTSFTFPNLKEFTLRDLHCLERWWETSNELQGEEVMFPRLEKLSIVRCAKMTALPDATLLGEAHGTMARSAFPALKELYLDCLYSFWKWEAGCGSQTGHIVFPKLENLTIMNCSMLTALPEAPCDGEYSMGRSAFPALKVLKLKCLSSFERWHSVEGSGSQRERLMFPQLEQLLVIHCENMTVLCGQQTFPSLKEIRIEFCPKLTTKAKSPKLSVLDMEGSEEEMFMWVARHMTSLTNLKLKNLEDTESTLEAADHSLTQVVDTMEKWNRDDFPMSIMHLTGLKSGVTELCACFVRLRWLCIKDCDALVHWPEKEFQGLVSLRNLEILYCKQLVGYAQATTTEPAATLESTILLLPSLESLKIFQCESMVEVFKLPASLRKLEILDCTKLKSILGGRLQHEHATSLNLQGRSPVYSRAEHSLFPSLEYIYIRRCDSLTGVLDLPPLLREITVSGCGELSLRAVESHSGNMPSLLEKLEILACKTMSSLPDGPQLYGSLKCLIILGCPGIKRLPTCLQQRLSSLELKCLDPHYEGPRLLNPKTWKYAIRRD